MEENKLSPVEFLVQLGNIYLDHGYHEFAIDAFTQAINLEPGSIDIYQKRGLAYCEAEQYADSIADFGVVIAVSTDKAAAYNNRGLSYYNTRMYQLALSDLNSAIELNPDNPLSYLNRGLVWVIFADYDESTADKYLTNAIADFTQAILLGSNDSITFVFRGETYLGMGEVQKALDDFNRALAIDPGEIAVHVNRILALSKP